MSIINLGFQCVGVMRRKMDDDFEKCISGCHSLKDLRNKCVQFKDVVVESLSQPKDLLGSMIRRLQLYEQYFNTFQSASDSEIEAFWEILLTVDGLLTREDTTKASLQKLPVLNQFISHCCVFKKYSITIKKCGKSGCSMCKPIKMPFEAFSGMLSLALHGVSSVHVHVCANVCSSV